MDIYLINGGNNDLRLISNSIQIIYSFCILFNGIQIILYGFSLGTGISFHLACNKNFPIAGCILQAPFLSILRIRYYLNVRFFRH